MPSYDGAGKSQVMSDGADTDNGANNMQDLSGGPFEGISASDLTEMWCLLEEEDVSNPPQAGSASQDPFPKTQQIWAADPDAALNSWAELGREWIEGC
jgi:hypothetical protein